MSPPRASADRGTAMNRLLDPQPHVAAVFNHDIRRGLAVHVSQTGDASRMDRESLSIRLPTSIAAVVAPISSVG
jgi:hypothetical protein